MTGLMEETETKTIGQVLVDAYRDRRHGAQKITVDLQRKDITQVAQLAHQPLLSAGASQAVGLPVRGRLVPVAPFSGGAISYVRENPAIPPALGGIEMAVAEGALKPEFSPVYQGITDGVKTFAVTFKISKQSMDDAGFLAEMITQKARTALSQKIDNEIILGTDGVLHLQGIMPLAATGPTGTTTAGAIGAAYAQLMAAGYVPDGIVFDGAAAGVLIGSGSLGLAADFNPQTGTLWGMRMAAITGSMGGNFLIGQFAGNSILLEREEITATIALMNEDDFTHNLATVRVEERSVLAVINYGAFLKCAVV